MAHTALFLTTTGQRRVTGHCMSAALEMLADDDMTTADEYITMC